MPIPYWVARLNKRFTNRFIEPITRRFRHYAVIAHRGRVSDRPYRTPVFVFFGDNSGFVALTYGPDADWVQNVLAGGGRYEHKRTEGELIEPRVVGRPEAWPHLPRWIRFFLRLLRVKDFVQFDTL